MLKRSASIWRFAVLGSFISIFASCGSGETPSAAPEDPGHAPSSVDADTPALDASVPFEAASSTAGDASVASVPVTPEALAKLTELRARFVVKVPPDDTGGDPSDDDAGPRDAEAPPPLTSSPLGEGIARGFEIGADLIVPHFPTSEARPARVGFSRKATAPFRIEDAASAMAVEVTLRDGRDVDAEAADGYLVYRHGHASGATLLHRALPEGTEDFLSFDERPAAPSVAYQLTLRNGVSGLRLVANTLEMLDAKGAPRLRVSPPSIITADGVEIDATLALDDCAYDDDPAPPWDRPLLAPGADTCTVRVTWPSETVTYPALLDPKWSTTGSMSVARQDHTATLLSTGKVLVVGGTNGTTTYATAELFDRTTGTWAATNSMTGARKLHTATQLGTSTNSTTSGRVLIAGGVNGTTTLNTAQLYSPTAGTWTAAANLNVARSTHSATLLPNGKVLVAGGASGSTTLNSAALYNPASGTGSWAATSNMATARKFHSATLLAMGSATLTNKVLVVGGNSGSASITSVQLFDGTSSWSTLTALSSAREQHTATLLANGKLLIAGGRNGSATLNTSMLFNPASGSGSWASAGTMKSARHGHTATLLSATALNDGQVLVAGGWDGSTTVSSAELFTEPSTWALTTALPAAGKYQTASLLTNSMVLLAGGVNAALNAVNTAVLYDPSRGKPCTTATQCASGFCANGVCCDSACTGECGACNLAGLGGTCSPKANGTACSDDGNVCTVDKCNGSSTTCQHPAGNAGVTCRPAATLCDLAESCSGTSATCPTDSKKPDGTLCDDGNTCTTADKCLNGACAPGTPVICGAPSICHFAGTCNPATGACDYPAAPPGTSCDDGNVCNGVALCDGAGSCLPAGSPPSTDDGNPCTDYMGCDPVTGPIQKPRAPGASCDSLCLTGGVGACDASGACVGGFAVTCTAADQCHGAGTCNPATGECSNPPVPDGTACEDGASCTQGETCQLGICNSQTHACTAGCPCDSGGSCTSDDQCLGGLVCGQQNGRVFGKDPLTSNCWPPACFDDPYYVGCGHTTWPCGLCPPAPPRVCTSDTDCQSTNEVCGQGNGAAFGVGNVNVCWPPACAGGQTLCGSPAAPCGNCSCVPQCTSKNCNTPDKSDNCGGYCAGTCGDGQTGCTSNLDCQGDSICANGTCLPPVCLALDPSRGCPGEHAACPNCPQCASLCASEGLDCGPDPAGCPGGCGTCSGGRACVDGKCLGSAGPPLPPVDTTALVGALDGSFRVTDGGQAQYSINIEVPPGRAGLQPVIGLLYTSDKTLGPQGIGWHLTGFSQIERCTTRAANEGPRPVRYDAGDRLCIDGRRLIRLDNTQPPPPLQVGEEFHTEVDDFSKIVLTGLDAQGQPDSFKVYTKAGTISTYGDTESTSVFHVLDQPLRALKRAWALSRIEDRNGNSVHFTYIARRAKDNTGQVRDTAEMVPNQVSYGANTAGGFPNDDRAVSFHYSDKDIIRSHHYVNGGEVTLQKQLDWIETSVQGQPVRRYILSYQDRGNVFQLSEAKECLPPTFAECKPSTTFSYIEGAQGTALNPNPTKVDDEHNRRLAFWQGASEDHNGDGADEWWIRGKQSDKSTFGRSVPEGSYIDLENDGTEALLSATVSTGPIITVDFQPYSFTCPWQANRTYAADIDGDGIKDVLLWNETELGYLKGGTITTTPACHTLLRSGKGEKRKPLLVDVDGDGVVNWVRDAGWDTVPNSGAPNWEYLDLTDPSKEQGEWKALVFYKIQKPWDVSNLLTIDANGDGLADLLHLEPLPSSTGAVTMKSVLWLNQGNGSFRRSETQNLPTDVTGSPSGLVFDFNGDGNDDYVMGYNWIQWTPSTLETQAATGPYSPLIRFNAEPNGESTYASFLADVNGDGDLDLIESADHLCLPAGPATDRYVVCPPQIRFGSSRRLHLLAGVVDGLGRNVDVVYNGNNKVSRNGTCAGRTDVLCPTTSAPLVGEHYSSTIGPDGAKKDRKFFEYSYADEHTGTNGRGSYGFGSRQIKEYEAVDNGPQPITWLPSTTTDIVFYNDEFALAGLVKSRTVTAEQQGQGVDGFVQPAQRVVEEIRDYQTRQVPARHTSFPALGHSTTNIYDKVASGRQTVSTDNNFFTGETDGYDDYGNNLYHLRQVVAGTNQLLTVTETNRTFVPDVDNWLVGLITSTEVRDSRSGGAVEIRNWTYAYHPDGSGRLHTRTRDLGGPFEQVEEYLYNDPVHNLTDYILQGGQEQRSTTFEYDLETRTFPHVTTNALGHPMTTAFDPRHGGLVSTVDANGLTETRTYDAFGRLARVDGPGGATRITLMKRDQAPPADAPGIPPAHPEAILRVLTAELSSSGTPGAMKVEDFGALGEILKRDLTGYRSLQDADQWVEETFTYDRVGRLRTQTRPHLSDVANDQGEILFAYDPSGQLIREILPGQIDPGDPNACGSTVVYHASATRNTWLDPSASGYLSGPGVATEAVSKRVCATVPPTTAFEEASVRIVDPDGLTVAARDPAGLYTEYTYGPYRELRTVRLGGNAGGGVTTIEYDTYGRMKSHTDPDMGVETYDVYNGFDELTSMTDARNIIKSYTYDALGRKTSASAIVNHLPPDNPVPDEVTTWDYDGVDGEQLGPNEIGRLTKVSTGSYSDPSRHQTRYHYRAGNFPLLAGVDRTIGSETFMTAFSYEDEFRRLVAVEYPTAGQGFAVRRRYDPRGNLVEVGDGIAGHDPYWLVTGTSQGYRIASETFGNHAVTSTQYEPFTGRLKSINTVSQGQNGTPLQGLEYKYTPNGNLQKRTDTTLPRVEEFLYDKRDRLEQINRNSQGWVQVATYDELGNFLTKDGVGTYGYDHPQGGPVHAPRTIVNGSTTRTFYYDAAGNELMRTGGPEGMRQTEYTSLNLPLSISDTLPSSLTTNFEYDGDGSRVIKSENSQNGVRETVYAGNLYERVTDTTGGATTVTHKYRIFAEGKQVAQVERKAGALDNTLYIHVDHLGSTQLITSGEAEQSSNFAHPQTFDPWGKVEGTAAWDEAAPPGVNNVHTGFTGHEHDPEHNLINMGGRIYDPELGRFTTPDPFVQHPLNSQSFNRYAYVYNNPLRYVDPSGFLPNNGPSALPGTQPEDVLAQDDACVSDPNTHCESFWTPDSVPTEPPEVEEQRRQATIAMSNQANMRFQGADFEQAKAPPQSNGRESQSKGNPGGDGLGPVIPRPGSGVRYAPLVELLPADAKTMLGKYFPNVNLDNVLIVVDPTMSRNRGTLAATTVASTLKGISIIRMRPGAYLYYGFNRAGVAEIGLGLRSGAGLSDRALGLGLLAHEIAHIAQVQLDLRKYGEEVGTALADVQYAFEDREAQGGWGPMEIGARAFGAMVARDVQAASGE